jgi:hypothetical protein
MTAPRKRPSAPARDPIREAAWSTMTCRQFAERFILIPDQDGALRPPILYPAFASLVDAIDVRDPVTGLRRYSMFDYFTGRKLGKSTLLGIVALYGLIVDPFGGVDREVLMLASDLAQARNIGFQSAVRFIERHPLLRSRCTVKQDEITYTETIVDPRSGGRYKSTSVLRAMPKDAKGLHGHGAGVVCIDEYWTVDQDMVDAALPSAARRSPFTLRTSYAGLRSQRHDSVPIYRAWREAERGDNPRVFSVILQGEAAPYQAPWMRREWIEDARASLPAPRFERMILNQWSAGDHALLTAAEIEAALTDAPEADRGIPGQAYLYAIDLGISFDWSALCIGHLAADTGQFIVDVIRTWRPEPGQPVNLMDVEREIVDLAQRWKPAKIILDAWNAKLLSDRLRSFGLPASMVGIDPTRLSRVTTLIKSTFSRRAIRIPRRETDLVDQLESLELTEGSVQAARRDLVKLQPGGAFGAGAHDDIAIALGLCLEACERTIGMLQLPPMHTCLRMANENRSAPGCYLVPGSWNLPAGNDPSCSHCAGHLAVTQMYANYLQRGGEECGLRDFYKSRVVPNDFVGLFGYAGALRSLGLS